ncbi:MAG: FtsQ-type POTRA domain-containing protein [Methyloprofundus sp.]|nr:FtsQ-type POTRA domain-containing protein [Methyloprofundus sp.]
MSKKWTLVQTAVGLLLIAVTIFSWPVIQKLMAEALPIRYVQVEGAFQYIKKQDIQEKINPLVQLGYLSVDLQQVQQAMMSLPWAEKVQVQRIWPDKLKLRIYEQKPVMRWRAASLINKQAEIFTPKNIDRFQVLPLLYVPIEQRQPLMQVMEGLSLSLLDHGLSLTEFRVNDRQSWLLATESGMVVQLGRFEPLQKFTLLMQSLMVLGSELVEKIAYVDMRYPNGYSVRWRGNEEIDWKKQLAKEQEK